MWAMVAGPLSLRLVGGPPLMPSHVSDFLCRAVGHFEEVLEL